jgi:nitroreductase
VEFRRAVGSWRSVRYFDPNRPVERGSIQAVLEAARLASRAMNVAWGKAIVVYRDELSEEQRNSLKTPYASVEFDLAPVYVLWYYDMQAQREALAQRRHPTVPSGAIQQVGGLAPPHGWSRKYVEEVVLPEVLVPLSEMPTGGGHPDASVAMAQALLCAVDEGLGACLVPFDAAAARRAFQIPETWEPVMALMLGHSLESAEAGGQRPRPDLGTVAFERDTSRPFRVEESFQKQLTSEGLYQTPAPLTWRSAEVQALSRGLRLPNGKPEPKAVADKRPEGDTTLEKLRKSSAVRTWLLSYQESWRSKIAEDEALSVLAKFVQFSGTEPDAIIAEVLQPLSTGDGMVLRTRGRRKYMKLIDEFESKEGSRQIANYVRSFMIHNGVAMNPEIIK